jgi:hypothetical protein
LIALVQFGALRLTRMREAVDSGLPRGSVT